MIRACLAAICIALPTIGLTQSVPEPLLGLWGTNAQCGGATVIDGGTYRATPFQITAGWLRHGSIWCRLQWFTPQIDGGGLYVAARAQCGEDAVNGYGIGFRHQASPETLTLIWDESLINGPLHRCK